ncbi:PIN domain nuclease [Candidatus Woesearchaeota archaeon]|nr:PIN domain nuclease [Candidatus Woesearchaeota archaeon]
MKIVLDSNVLFSALIKDSVTRKLILEYDDLFLFPFYIFEEMEEHKGELMIKSKMEKDKFEELLELLLKKVIIVSKEDLKIHKEESLEIVKDIDKDDTVFIACALAYPESIIWSDDKKLKEQNKVKILNTSEIIALLNK